MSLNEKLFMFFMVMVVVLIGTFAYLFLFKEMTDSRDPGVSGLLEDWEEGLVDPGNHEEGREISKEGDRIPDHGTSEMEADKNVRGMKSPVTVNLHDNGQVFGRVLDDKKNPLPGAEVILYSAFRLSRKGDSIASRQKAYLRAFTDERGQYFFQDVPAREVYELSAVLEGTAPFSRPKITLKSGESREVPDLILGKGWRLHGLVSNEGGGLIKDAVVFLDRRDAYTNMMESEARATQENQAGAPGPSVAEVPWRRKARTDGRGAYTFGTIGVGHYEVVAWIEGFSAVIKKVDTKSPSDPGRDLKLDFILERSKEIQGLVMDNWNNPVGGVQIRAREARFKGFGSRSRTESDEDSGRFVLSNLHSGRYIIDARKPGYLPAFVSNIEAETLDLILTLQKTSTISGVVTSLDTGEPVTTFSIAVLSARAPGSGPGTLILDWKSFHAPDGQFEVEGLQRGRYIVAARADGYGEGHSESITLNEEEKKGPISITMEKGNVLKGKVSSSKGMPVAEARVELIPRMARSGIIPGMPLAEEFRAGPGDDAGYLSAVTDSDGLFHFENALEGVFSLGVTHPDYRKHVVPEVTVEKAMAKWAGEVVLEQGGRLECTVIDGEGNPLPDTLVYILGIDMDTQHFATTGETGVVGVKGLPPGRYVLSSPETSFPLDPGGVLNSARNKIEVLISEGEITFVDFAPSL